MLFPNMFVSGLISWLAVASAWAADSPSPPRPAPPPATVPDLATVRPVVICGDCDQPFSGTIHKLMLDKLVANEYIGELRKALYLQDTVHQFESKAHFDNCDFDNAINYIDELLKEVGTHVQAAQSARDSGDKVAQKAGASRAFFALGQALHGVQDFYAHTNYVEMMVGGVKRTTDIPVILPWTSAGKEAIRQQQASGKLVSGYVFWGIPQNCPRGTPSHADLAKDDAESKSGMIRIAHLQNRSQHQVAVQLAREASQELVDHAFAKWPLLKELNGKLVAVEVLVDRRKP